MCEAIDVLKLMRLPLRDTRVAHVFALLGKPSDVMPTESGPLYHFRDSGLAFRVDGDDRVATIQLFASGFQGGGECRLTPPLGILFVDSAEAILSKLGQPIVKGGGEESILYDETPTWYRYQYAEGLVVHIQFAPGEGAVDLVTIMLAETAP